MHAEAQRPSTAAANRQRFAFGGVYFDVRFETASGSLCTPPPCSRRSDPGDGALAGRVTCSVDLDAGSRAALPDPVDAAAPRGRRWVRWTRRAEGWDVETTGVRAHVWPRRPGGPSRAPAYRATASLEGPSSLTNLVSAVASLVVSENAGLVLHAASIVLCGGVVAFIGPSGAGKSTACQLCAPAPQFSLDRLAIAPGREGRWWAHALPGGNAAGLEGSNRLALPLRGILRVRRAEPPCQASLDSGRGNGALRVHDIRESCFHGSKDKLSELSLLCTAETLCREVPVGEIHTRLGVSALAEVEGWLRREANE